MKEEYNGVQSEKRLHPSTSYRYNVNKNCIETSDGDFVLYVNSVDGTRIANKLTVLEKENEQLKSELAKLIRQNRKNNELLLSDIRILEKALWCPNCANDFSRLKELQKEFKKVI